MVHPRETAVRSSHAVFRPSQPTVADRVGQRRRPAPGRSSVPTVAACIKRFCLNCLGLTSVRELSIVSHGSARSIRHQLSGAADVGGRPRASSPPTAATVSPAIRPTAATMIARCSSGDPGSQEGSPTRTVSEAQRRRLLAIGQPSQFRNPRQ